jgi:hypothetical protein
MAANFGYTEEYVDNELDMDRLFSHLDYLKKCPPIGYLFKSFIEAQFGDGKGDGNSPVPQPRNKAYQTDQERRMDEKNKLHKMCADFGVDVNSLQKKPTRRLRNII